MWRESEDEHKGIEERSKPVVWLEIDDERKDIEQPEVSKIKSEYSESFTKQKQKYPFYNKIDFQIDSVVRNIFSETRNSVVKLFTHTKQYLSPKKQAKFNNNAYDDMKMEESRNTNFTIEEMQFDDDEKEMFKQFAAMRKMEIEYEYEREIETDTEIFPLTVAEIKRERRKSLNLLQKGDTLSKYEQTLIHIICKQFESIFFRTPSLKEIALILVKSTQKMKEYYYENRGILHLMTPKTTVDWVKNEEKMMLDCFERFVSDKANGENPEMIVETLMSRMEEEGFF